MKSCEDCLHIEVCTYTKEREKENTRILERRWVEDADITCKYFMPWPPAEEDENKEPEEEIPVVTPPIEEEEEGNEENEQENSEES